VWQILSRAIHHVRHPLRFRTVRSQIVQTVECESGPKDMVNGDLRCSYDIWHLPRPDLIGYGG
jgi:hypothetical protein